jgi:acyl transferase domain-containing protein/SAM-dependent methyltransferase
MAPDPQMQALSPAKRALYEIRNLRSRLQRLELARSEPVAVVGLGLRFPGGAVDADSFWRLLAGGVDAVSDIPPGRWNIESYYDPDPDAPGKMYTRHGAFLEDVAGFDAEFFGVSPREAATLDPQHRLALEVAWEALEDAGQNPAGLAGSATGVFLACSNSDYARRVFARTSEIDAYSSTGNSFSAAVGRISYTLGLEGPSMAVDTACSGSLVAVHLACGSLRSGECRMALAGGFNLILSPEININFSKSRMMAADGRCKTFDARADGYVRGEGCGMVALKRLSDALADGDRILGLIRGSAVNQDGRSGGLTVPNGTAQQAVIRQALANAGVEPREIGYVEAHGTGTALGDPIEAHALAAALGVGRPAGEPLAVGSVKTNIGHLEAAAGIAGLIKTILALDRGQIPPHLHFREMNPRIDWGGLEVRIPVGLMEWPRGPKRRLAGVSSFGFSGANAHVIVEEAPQRPFPDPGTDRPAHVLALSARTGSALGELARRYAAHLASSAAPLADVCYTANAGRAHFSHRAVYVAGPGESIQAALAGRPLRSGESAGAPEIVFLFPGQGAQYAGMAKQLYDTQPVFRRALDECDELLRPRLEGGLLRVLYGDGAGLLDRTACAQPALFAIEYALAELWRSWGVRPAAVLGHSVGEYAAACVAGQLDLADGLRLIAARGRLMQELPGEGSMMAVMAPEERVRAAVAEFPGAVSIAALNAPGEVVISGYDPQVQAIARRFRDQGVRVQALAVSHAFHSPQMAAMVDRFAALAGEIRFHEPRVSVVSSVTGRMAGPDEMANPEYWRRQVTEPVRFQAAMETLAREGRRTFLEVGPGTTLLALGQRCLGNGESLWLASVRRTRDDWRQMTESLAQLYVAGAEIDWAGFDRPYPRRKVTLPTYPFERRRYWIEEAPAAVAPASGRVWESMLESAARQSGHCPLELRVETYAQRWECLDKLTIEYIAEALRHLGLFRTAGERLSPEALIRRGGISKSHRKLIESWLARAAAAGLLERAGEEFIAVRPLAPASTVSLMAEAERIFGEDRAFLDYAVWCGERLPAILTGEVSPIETLFPGGDFTRAEDLYERAPLSRYFSGIARAAVEGIVRSRAGLPLRAIEIGAGTGATTAALLPALPPETSTYDFTDISQRFLDRAARKFAAYPFLRYGLLDVERAGPDPSYPDGCCDIVVATNVLHAARDIGAAISRVRRLLAPGGFLVLCEATTYLSWFDITTGLIEGWQAFEDALRRDRPLLSGDDWQKALAAGGFERCRVFPEPGSPAEVLGQHVILAQAPGATTAPARRASARDAAPPKAARQAMENEMDRLRRAPASEQREALVELVRRNIAELLGMDSTDRVPRKRRLIDLGLDSLMAVELRNRLVNALELERPLPATLVFDHPTIEAMAEYLWNDVLRLSEETGSTEAPDEPMAGRAGEIESLADDEVEALLRAKLQAL